MTDRLFAFTASGELGVDPCAGTLPVGIACMHLPETGIILGGYMDDNWLECGWKKLVQIFSLPLFNDELTTRK